MSSCKRSSSFERPLRILCTYLSLAQLLLRLHDRAMMSFTTLLAICLSLSLCASCYPSEPATQQHAPPSTPPVPFPTVYSPVVLAQLCEEPTSYCIYVDQIRPGAVRASPVNATDDRKQNTLSVSAFPHRLVLTIISLHCLDIAFAEGAFLFERASYMSHPFHVCYGGCCIDLDFASKPGCVSMRYFNRKSNEAGHLLARFADNVEQILGPREYMQKELIACPTKDEPALPYAVIGARGGQGRPEQEQQVSHLQTHPTQGKAHVQPHSAGANAAQNGDGGKSKVDHDYFDDVTVPLADLV
ncbi:hypothetical protein PHSY_002762 [Pseudozyma hubeiensis SY62]|uniref:Uncharacterized protein n=1 Tax=Pseudozyma hubeiensis (strain SY62) TaxID=1305764 RepID=R9P1X9_PSEHS|nr:hypothetical protein PHSY_002762 [Pseudozyma hubeiensis SY62]GAC95187.1 hypothetical protein PHSY_002762 [Pseudozyma hubeiensis SY62]